MCVCVCVCERERVCARMWLLAAAGTMTGCASASLLAAPEPSKHHWHPLPFSLSLLLYLCLFLFSSTSPIRECWWDVFCRKEKIHTHTHTHTQAWAGEEGVVDKGRDVLLFYIRDAFVCWGLTCLTGCQSPLFLPTSLSPSLSLYYPAHSGHLFFHRLGQSWILIIPYVVVKKFCRFLKNKIL